MSHRRPGPSSYLDFAHSLADLAGGVVLPYFRRRLKVDNKAGTGGFDPVTAADRAAERAIRTAIAKGFPDHGIVGEEFPDRPGAGRYTWFLDPIDGTRAFIMGSPLWGTLIGLSDKGKPILGMMDQPFTRERFWGVRGHARMRELNGRTRKLKTRDCDSLRNAVLTTTHPDLLGPRSDAAAFERLTKKVRMTRYGGDCYGYCLLAAGYVDLVVEVGLKAHDVAALIPIIEGGGGRITTWEGASAAKGGRVIAAGDARMHKEAMAILNG